MRTSVFVGTSLDGFIARSNGAFDFLAGADGEPHGYDEFFATVDVVVMGRNTYDIVRPFPKWPYGKKPVVVLSSRPLPPAPDGAAVEAMSGEPAEILTRLDARGLDHVYVDGGVTVQSFLRRGLIQRVVITRVPVLIGAGIPLFGPLDADVHLQHVATRSLAGGAVQSEYVIEAFAFPSPRRGDG
jgi:dihydrofolate reductase